MNKAINNRISFKLYLVLSLGLLFNTTLAQTKNSKKMKLKTVSNEMVVFVSPEKAWSVLADFGQIGDFHTGVLSSKSLNNSPNEAGLGCERECVITEGRKPIVIKERIVEFKESQSYTYDVYEWQNFPISKMYVTFGVKTNQMGQTVIYQRNDFRLKPGFLTGIMKGKIRKGGFDSLLAYKHFMETDEKNVDIKTLKKKYKDARL